MSDDTLDLLTELLAVTATGQAVVLATVVKARGSAPRHAGSKMLVYADGRIRGTIGGGEMESRVIQAALAALQTGTSHVITYSLVELQRGDAGVCGGEMDIYLEPYLPPATLFIVGCGHVGQALAHLAHWLGYRVVVTDDRPELASPTHIPQADVYLPGDLPTVLAQHPITPYTYVVVVTRNIQLDQQNLPLLLQTPAAYIGVMGSRRRWAETQRLLLADGLPAAALTRVQTPIGLEIQAETPAEIAVSIMAQIIQQRHRPAIPS